MIRWAIVGTSFISDTMARAIAGSPGSVAVVAVGRDSTRLHEFCERHSIAGSVNTVEDALRDPHIDVVYVGTPNHTHHLLTALAAKSGKAVLSEKSLTVSMAQTESLLTAVRDGGGFFVEGLMYLAHSVIARFVEVLLDGRLGKLKTISASYAANIARLVNPEGEGAIYNLGCYPASLVQLVIDAVEGDGSFTRRGFSAHGNVSTTDGNICETAAAVRFDSGTLAMIHTAETYGNVARFEVQGEHGTLVFETNPWLPEPGDNSFVWTAFDGSTETFVVNDPLDAFDHQVRMVEANLIAGRVEAQRPSPRWSDSRDLMSFLTDWEQKVHGE
jgi:predicted dehydrogenase